MSDVKYRMPTTLPGPSDNDLAGGMTVALGIRPYGHPTLDSVGPGADIVNGMSRGSVELEPEVRDWLEGLSGAEFGRAVFYVDLLAERGVLLSEPYTKQLDGKLRELRFDLGRRAMLACIEDEHIVDEEE